MSPLMILSVNRAAACARWNSRYISCARLESLVRYLTAHDLFFVGGLVVKGIDELVAQRALRQFKLGRIETTCAHVFDQRVYPRTEAVFFLLHDCRQLLLELAPPFRDGDTALQQDGAQLMISAVRSPTKN